MQVLTRRGKRLQKYYTVFVCKIIGDRDAYIPTLNKEHSQWKWIPIESLRSSLDVHPVVHCVLHDHWLDVKPLLDTCG
jgi:hypothetical protein